MKALTETRKLIEWARKQGATHVKCGDVEITFGGPPAAMLAEQPLPSDPRERERELKRRRDELAYGSS